MKKLLTLTVVLLMIGCNDDNNNETFFKNTIDFNAFTIQAPDGWERFDQIGIDSYVGGMTNGQDTITFDYGFYSYNFSNETSDTYIRNNIKVDGKSALLIQPKEKMKGIIGLYVEVDQSVRLCLAARPTLNESTIINMYKSVKF